MVYNILLSLAFTHEANVMHRDLKPENILLNGSCNAKLCDFGNSRTIPKQNMGAEGYNTRSIRE
jgi:serine/threonine protein kinase